MRYHLTLKFNGKLVKIAQTFCLNLVVQRYMSTSVYLNLTETCQNDAQLFFKKNSCLGLIKPNGKSGYKFFSEYSLIEIFLKNKKKFGLRKFKN